MPGSYGIFDDVVTEIIRQLQPKTLLDIGTGSGKYGRITSVVSPESKRIGIEVEAQYIEQYDLRNLYHEVRQIDATTLLHQSSSETFDLVVIGDCIEHMPKSLGLDLLNYLTYRAQYILVLAPEFCVQGAIGDIPSESHISVWSEADFAWHDLWAFENSTTMCLFLLRGYQHSPIALSQVVEKINGTALPVMDFFREKKLRNAHLTLHSRLRNETINGAEHCFRPK